jgi:cobalamin biosynthesis protein CbiG
VKELAIATLTPRGLELGRRLVQALEGGELVSAQGGGRQTLQELFKAGRPLVCIMALGIVVRVLGPLAQNKGTDPPVVVVDDAGQFVISVLGGHAAGANELARRVAKALGAHPVITTASDALGRPAVDLIGREWGWKVEGRENLTKVAAAIVRGDRVGVYQTAGREDWWKVFGDWPTTFQRVETRPEGDWAAILVISDCSLPGTLPHPTVIFRPPTLVLGVGCRRGVPCSAFEDVFQDICRTRGFSPLSLGLVATASLKADEPGLVEFAARHEVPLVSFSIEELGRVADLPTPSEKVRAKLGIAGVAEPAALLAARSNRLLLPKYRGQRVTMALAQRDDA